MHAGARGRRADQHVDAGTDRHPHAVKDGMGQRQRPLEADLGGGRLALGRHACRMGLIRHRLVPPLSACTRLTLSHRHALEPGDLVGLDPAGGMPQQRRRRLPFLGVSVGFDQQERAACPQVPVELLRLPA